MQKIKQKKDDPKWKTTVKRERQKEQSGQARSDNGNVTGWTLLQGHKKKAWQTDGKNALRPTERAKKSGGEFEGDSERIKNG